jgi:radical SAM protein with 4Fe4S-binding SPASM domain
MLPVEANGDVVDCMHWGTRPIGNLRDRPLREILDSPRLRELAGDAGEACHKCVSIHRVEISEVWEGNLEPIRSWMLLRRGHRDGRDELGWRPWTTTTST